MDIKNAKVLVTGGSAGIGLDTAKLLAERGAQVVICGRDRKKLDDAAAACGCTAVQADVSVEADAVRVVKETIGALGGYNVLINNAGFGTFGPLVDTTLDEMERVYRTNVFGAMLVARESAKYFIEQDTGNILNIGSTAGDKGFGGGGVYASTKAAIKSMTESWRDELRPANIRVVLIKPSEVVTHFAKAAGYPQEDSPRKLHGIDLAYAILHALEQPDAGFTPEVPVWATNPKG